MKLAKKIDASVVLIQTFLVHTYQKSIQVSAKIVYSVSPASGCQISLFSKLLDGDEYAHVSFSVQVSRKPL